GIRRPRPVEKRNSPGWINTEGAAPGKPQNRCMPLTPESAGDTDSTASSAPAEAAGQVGRGRRVEHDRSSRVSDREILRLAVPAFGALVAEPLFLLTDSVIVGHLPDPALGALGLAGTVLAALIGLCVFLAYGTTAAVARQLGSGNLAQAMRRGIDGLWLAAVIGVTISAVCWPLAPSIVHVFGAEGTLATLA